MSRDILVIPCWRRPEFLKVWIEIICKAELSQKLYYLFCLDAGFDPRHIEILKEFPYSYGIIKMPPSNYKLGKQSYNVLNGMVVASEKAKDFVFYVEDDIFVAKDFFKMHYEIHEQHPEIFCSVGTKCNNTNWKTTDDKNAYYLSHNPDYQSWGSCFKKGKIQEHIKPHFNNGYFINPNKYCSDHFPESIVGNRFTEQDGLIRRIVEKTDLDIAYPHVPRGYHAGFYGYNREGKGKHLSYEQKCELVRKVAFSPEEMRKHCVNEGYYSDSVPVDLDINENEWYLKQCK